MGLRRQAQFVAARTLGLLFYPLISPLPTSPCVHFTVCSWSPITSSKNPISSSKSEVFGDIKGDISPQIVYIQEQIGGAGGGRAQETLFSVTITRNRFSRHSALRHFLVPTFQDTTPRTLDVLCQGPVQSSSSSLTAGTQELGPLIPNFFV